jgi:hypothetical protein
MQASLILSCLAVLALTHQGVLSMYTVHNANKAKPVGKAAGKQQFKYFFLSQQPTDS